MFGLDHLGLAKYGKLAAGEHPDGWALGAFSGLSGFGDALPAVKAILDSGRCPRVRLHLYWSDRGGHKPDPDYLLRIEKEAIRVGRFYSAYVGKVDCRVSGFCEHPLSVSEAAKVRDVVMKHMPAGVTYVNSFVESLGGKPLPGVVNEVHGSKSRVPSGAYDFSYDGQSCFDVDVESHKKKFGSAQTFYFWFPQCNGRMKLEDKTPRDKRKAYPTSRLIDSAIYLHQASGVSGKLPKGYILKTHSDQHTVPPGSRDCVPVIIAPVKTKEIFITTRSGQVVERLPFYGPFSGGGFRYYAKDYGYLLAEKAKRIQGDAVCQLRVNGKAVGNINPGFRAGTFR